MNQTYHHQLESIIAQQMQQAPSEAMPVVSLESFFSGNDIEGSFATNRDVSPIAFYEALQAIQARAEVKHLAVIIESWGELEPEHPYSDKYCLDDDEAPRTHRARDDISKSLSETESFLVGVMPVFSCVFFHKKDYFLMV